MRLAMAWLGAWFTASLAASLLLPDAHFELSHALEWGRDTYGRLLLPLVLQGSLRSMAFSLAAVLVAVVSSLALAGLIALLPARGASPLESALDFMVAFPSLLFALSIGAWIGPGAGTVFAALVLGLVPGLSRTLLARAREIQSQPFTQAARALGAGTPHIAIRHLFPHLLPMVSVKLPSLLLHALLAESSLSFLGLGFSAGTESWGTLLAQGREYLIEAPGISFFVGIPLVLSIWSFDVISKHLEPEVP